MESVGYVDTVHPSHFASLKVGPQELGLPNCVEAISQALDK